MSLASRAVALLQKQYEVIFHRMRQCQWSVEFGAIVSMLKDSVGGFHVATRGGNRQCSIEALEPRLLMTTLYWDPSAAAGLQAGSGAWDTTTQNWNTAADGSGAQVAWTNGADAVFAANGSSTVTISSGLTANSITFGGSGYIITGSTLTLTGSASIVTNQDATIANVITGTVGLSETGSGTLILTGANTYTGITTISSGSTLQLGNGGNTGSLSTGAITDNGLLIVNRSNALTMANVISGTGDVTQNGTNTLTLSGANTYTGTTTINAGTLYLYGNTRLSSATSMVIASIGTLSMSGVEAVSSLNGSGTINLGSYTLTVGGDGSSTTYSGMISGAGGLTKTGAGTLTLTGANTYTGATTISGGALQIGDGWSGNISTGAIVNNSNLVINRSVSLTMANVISGTGSLTTYGDIALTGTNSFTGSTTVNGSITLGNTYGLRYSTVLLDNGYLYFSTVTSAVVGAIQGNSYITLNNTTSAAVALSVGGNNASTTYSGTLTGTGSLVKAGTGTFILTGNEDYTGTTTISAGALQLSNSSGGISLSGNVVNSGSLIIDNNFWDYYGVMSGAGSLTLINGMGLWFEANNSFSGTTTIGEGCLLGIGNADTIGSIGSGAIINNGELQINRSNAITVANAISGTGNLSMAGSGILTLSGSNTYSGYTNFSSGSTLVLGNANALKNSTLEYYSFGSGAISFGSLTSASLGALEGNADLALRNSSGGAVALSVGYNNSDTFYTGALSGSGSLTKIGTGTLQLWGANTYTGSTTVSGGTLDLLISGNGDVPTYAGAIVNNSNLILESSTCTLSGVISGAGSLTIWGGFTLAAANSFTGSTTVEGDLTLNNIYALRYSTTILDYSNLYFGTVTSAIVGALQGFGYIDLENSTSSAVTLSVGGNNASSEFSGQLTGPGNLTKTGTGTLTLSGSNNYTGTTTISAGIVALNGGGNTLGGYGAVSLANVAGTALTLYDDEMIGALTGGGTTGGKVLLGNYTLTVGINDASTTYGGVISGTGNLGKTGIGTLTLTGANTYSGTTTIDGGTLQVGAGSTVGNIATGDVINNGQLTIYRSNATTFANNISGTGSFVKAGAGDLTLSGVNTFSGSTTVNGGNLYASGGSALSAQSDLIFADVSGVRLILNSDQTVGSMSGGGSVGGHLNIGSYTLSIGANNTSTTFSGMIGGTGGITKLGTGTLIFTGANAYTGATTINDGTLQIGAGGTAGSISTGNIIDNGTLVFNNSDATTVANVISGTGDLVQAGTGTLTLSAGNNFAGITTINAGTLALANYNALNSSTLDTSGAGALSFGSLTNATFGGLQGSRSLSLQNSSSAAVVLTIGNNGANTSFAGALSGLGSLVKVGTGTLVLTGTNTYSGSTTISAGTIQIGSGTTTGNLGNGSITDNGSLIFNRSDTLSVSNIITGIGNLSQCGTGTLILAGNNTYSGITTIASGSLQVGNGGTAGTLGAGNIVNNGTLAFNRSNNVAISNVISGNGNFTKLASNTLTLNAANTFSGLTRISNGTLILANNLALQNSTLDMNVADAGVLNFGTLTTSTLGGLQGSRNLALINSSSASVAMVVGTNNCDTVYSGVLSGTGSIQKVGTGTLVLAGTNSNSGVTRIDSGALQIGNGGTAGTLGTGDVYNSGQLIINRSDNITLANVIHNTGLLVQSGSGHLIFPADKSINGMLAVNASSTAESTVVQQTGAVLSAGTTYILQVNVRGPINSQLNLADYRIELHAGNTVLAVDDNSLVLGSNQSLLSTLVYTAPANSDVLGQPLEIWLVAKESSTSAQIIFSDIQLNNVALHLVGDSTSDEGSTYVLTVGSSGSMVPSQFNVEWGDGQSNVYTTFGDKAHTYLDGDAAGTPQTILIHFYDSHGVLLSSLSKPISILNVAPTITVTGATSVNEGDVYILALGPVLDPGQDTIQQYVVNWGDGQTSTIAAADLPEDRNVTHIYTDGTTVGTSHQLFVSLVDEDGTYINAASLNLVAYDNVPTISASGTDVVNEGDPYTLTLGEISGLGYDNVKDYIINWGDGETSVIAAVDLPDNRQINHVYVDGSNQGTLRTIRISVEDFSETYADLARLDLVVRDVPPSLTISGATSVDEGSPYTLTLGYPTDPGQDTISAYSINWGDGQVTNINAVDLPADRLLTHVYADGASGGTPHTIHIGVVDEDGVHTDIARLDIVVNDVTPSLSINGAASINEGELYTLTIGNPTDPGQDTISSYSINWGDGQTTNVAVADIPANRQLTHVYADGANGGTSRTIQLDVIDEDGVHSDVANLGLIVNDVAPTLTISGVSSVERNTTYTLNLTASDAGTDTISSWNINWGDGSDPDNDGIVGQIVQGNPSAVTHVYDNAGQTYSIAATATDKDGIFSALPINVRVTIPVSVHVAADGKTAVLAVLGTDADGDSTYTWSLIGTAPGTVSYSDNGTNGSKNTVATFSAAGTYGFLVTITNADHLVTTQTLQVTVDQVITSLVTASATHAPTANGTQQFVVTGYDQFGKTMVTQPGVTWSVTGSGYAITNNGLLTAGSTPGSYTVTATSGSVTSEALTFSSKITITAPASATLDSDTHTTAELSVSASAPWGGSDLTYQWLAANDSASYVSFSDNGSSSANHTIAYLSAAGTYHFLVKITDSLGASTTSEVSITVAQTLTSIHVTSSESAPAANGTQQFSTVALDQFGKSMTVQPSLTWSVNGAGYSISSDGLLTAGTSIGSYGVTASSGGVISNTVSYSNSLAIAQPATATLDTSGTYATLAVLGTNLLGGSDLAYSWQLTSGNASHVTLYKDAAATNEALAYFDAAGSYQFTVTISNGNGQSITSSVDVNIAQILTSIVITPLDTAPGANGMQHFSATAYDQFSHALVNQPNFTWTVDNSGYSISGDGVLSAPSTLGNYRVTAHSGNISSTSLPFSQTTTVAAAPAATVDSTTHTTVALSVLGADAGGESRLTYAWKLIGDAPADVNFSSNQTNSAKNTTATLSAAGTYQFQVTITNRSGVSTTAAVTVVVGQVLSSIAATTTDPTPAVNDTQQFSAIAYDQFGNAMASQPTLTWGVNGDGYTISPDGLLTAGSTPGSYTVTASSNGIASNSISYSQTLTQTSAASATLDSSGTYAALHVGATNASGGSNLIYTWSLTSGNANHVGFYDNGDNAASSTLAYFNAAGTYDFLVTVTDAQGNSLNFTVSVTVDQILTGITITSTDSAPSANGTQQFTSVAYDQFGMALATQPALSWSVDNAGYTISATGLLTAGATRGEYTVTATSGETVSNTLSYSATLSSSAYGYVNWPTQTTATLVGNASGGSNLTYVWTLTDDAPASVSFSDNASSTANNTTATFTAAGTYKFILHAYDADGHETTSFVSLTVDQVNSRLVVAASSASPTANGTQQFMAVAYDQFGNIMATQPTLNWQVSGSGYSISSNGLLTAGAATGAYSVSVSDGSHNNSTSFSSALSLTASANAALDTSKTYAMLSALATDTLGGQDLTYTWTLTSGNADNIYFEDNETSTAAHTIVDFYGAGTYQFLVTISDSSGHTVTSATSVTVDSVVASIDVISSDPIAQPNGTQQFSAIAYDQFGNVMATQPTFSWSSSGNASISSDGLFTMGDSTGAYDVAVSANGVTGRADPLAFAPIVTQQAQATVSSDGKSAYLTVQALGMNGGDGLSYEWSTDSDGVTFSGNGGSVTATFMKVGTYELTCTIINQYGLSVTSQTSFTVNQQLASIAITSTNPPVEPNGSSQFVAKAYDQFGDEMSNPPEFAWTISGSGNTIDSSGNLSAGSAPGTFTVTATTRGKTITTSVDIKGMVYTPVLHDQNVSVNKNNSINFSVIDGDTAGDPAGSAYIAHYAGLVRGPQHGTVSVGDTGYAYYMPDHDYIGSDSFTIETYNNDWVGGTKTITITVNGDSQAPSYPDQPSPRTYEPIEDVPEKGSAEIQGDVLFNCNGVILDVFASPGDMDSKIFGSFDGNTLTITSTSPGNNYVGVNQLTSNGNAISVVWAGTTSTDWLTVVNMDVLGDINVNGKLFFSCNELTGNIHAGSMAPEDYTTYYTNLNYYSVYGNMSGSVTYDDTIILRVQGNVTGNITSEQGGIGLSAGGDVNCSLSANTYVGVNASGEVSGTITAQTGSISATGRNVSSSMTAYTGVWVYAHSFFSGLDGGQLSSTITSDHGGITLNADKDISSNISSSGSDSISITTGNDFTGSISGLNDHIWVTTGGNMSGSVISNGHGDIDVTVGRNSSGQIQTATGDLRYIRVAGDLSSSLTSTSGHVYYVSAGDSISGNITAYAGIETIDAGVDISCSIASATGRIVRVKALRDVSAQITTGVQNLHEVIAGRDASGNYTSGSSIDYITVGRDLSANVTVAMSLAQVAVGRKLSGNLTAQSGFIGTVDVGASWADSYTSAGSIDGSTIKAGTYVGPVTVTADPGYEGAISNATITAEDGDIGDITAVSGIGVTATASGNIGRVTTARGDIEGKVTTTIGNIGDVTASDGSISADVKAGGTIGDIIAAKDITGDIHAGGDIGEVKATLGEISGSITSDGENIGDICAGKEISGNVHAARNIGNIISGDSLSGTIVADYGSIGFIWSMGDISQNITSHEGELNLLSNGDVSGDLTAESRISVQATGNVSGSIYSVSGEILIAAAQNVSSSNITAKGSVVINADGNVTSNVSSKNGSISVFGDGNVSADFDADANISVTAEKIDGVVSPGFSAILLAPDGADATIEPVCFAAGTLVLLADGSSIPIEQVTPGMSVLSIPENLPASEPAPFQVEDVYHKAPNRLFEIKIADHIIKATERHPFYVEDKGWTLVKDLKAGDLLKTSTGGTVCVKGVRDSGISEAVYNLHVRNAHTYFVSLKQNGVAVWVHNDSCSDNKMHDNLLKQIAYLINAERIVSKADTQYTEEKLAVFWAIRLKRLDLQAELQNRGVDWRQIVAQLQDTSKTIEKALGDYTKQVQKAYSVADALDPGNTVNSNLNKKEAEILQKIWEHNENLSKYKDKCGKINKAISLLTGTLEFSQNETSGDILINGAKILDAVSKIAGDNDTGIGKMLQFYTSAMTAIGVQMNDFINVFSAASLEAWKNNATPETYTGKIDASDGERDTPAYSTAGGEVPFTRPWAIKQLNEQLKKHANDEKFVAFFQKIINDIPKN